MLLIEEPSFLPQIEKHFRADLFILFYVCFVCIICIYHMCAWCSQGQKRVELELWMVRNHHAGAGN